MFYHKESSAMKTAITAFLAVFVLSTVGIWGCAQQKNNAQTRKIDNLEKRYAKLEEDYRTVVAAGENTRKKLSQMEVLQQQQAKEREQYKVAILERDDLKQKLVVRTNERDGIQTQLMQFGKELNDKSMAVAAVLRDLQGFNTQVQTATNTFAASPGNGAPVAAPNALKTD
jgi:hypothetical protein